MQASYSCAKVWLPTYGQAKVYLQHAHDHQDIMAASNLKLDKPQAAPSKVARPVGPAKHISLHHILHVWEYLPCTRMWKSALCV